MCDDLHNRSSRTKPAFIVSWCVLFTIYFFSWYVAPEWGPFGPYSSTDGDFVAWNQTIIMEWGQFLGLSPFNIFGGFGGLYLPNLPWLNPGAVPLGLLDDPKTAYLVSFSAYFIEICISLYLLCRAINFSPLLSCMAVQTRLLITFPIVALIKNELPWYSVSPVNIHLAADHRIQADTADRT